jgi:hypothetical protein
MQSKVKSQPTFEDLVKDPIIRMVMKADGVTEADLSTLVVEWRGRMNKSAELLAA